MAKNNGKGYELIIGTPSYMESDSIGYVTEQIDRGIQEYFPDYRAVIVNVDNDSPDDTKGAFLGTDTVTEKKYITTPKGVKGKGNNFLNLFRFGSKHADSLKAVIVVDSDLMSITPEWIRDLAYPVIKKKFDYVLPRYSRHQFDGTITNHICYPMLYGLIGENIRQPIGGDFAFSPRLMEYWLEQKWHPTTKQYGIDIFMTMNAILGEFRICEVGLGAKKHKASSPKLGPMFTQVVTTFFEMILERKADWIGIPVNDPKPKPLFGQQRLDPPQELSVDLRDLKDKLRQEYLPREKLLKKFLSSYLFRSFEEMVHQDHFSMSILMWTQAVYQLLFSFDTGGSKTKKDIVEALKPLYFARSVTFDYETWKYRIDYAEKALLEQSMAFASQKPYFYGLYLKQAQNHKKKKKG